MLEVISSKFGSLVAVKNVRQRFFTQLSSVWNLLPPYVVDAPSLNGFTAGLSQILITSGGIGNLILITKLISTVIFLSTE